MIRKSGGGFSEKIMLRHSVDGTNFQTAITCAGRSPSDDAGSSGVHDIWGWSIGSFSTKLIGGGKARCIV